MFGCSFLRASWPIVFRLKFISLPLLNPWPLEEIWNELSTKNDIHWRWGHPSQCWILWWPNLVDAQCWLCMCTFDEINLTFDTWYYSCLTLIATVLNWIFFGGGVLQLPDWSSVFSRYGNPTNIIWNNATQFSTAGWASLLLKSRIQNNNRLWLRWLLVCNMCGALHATTATSPQQLLNNNKIHIFRIPKALAQRGHWWWCLIHDHLQGTGWVLEKPHTCNHFWYLSRRSPAKGWIDLVSRDSV